MLVTPAPFILGVGRSGTTLLRLMLDAHPDLAIPPETHFLPLIGESAGNPDVFARLIVESDTWPNFGLSADVFRGALKALQPFDVTEATRIFYRLYAQRFGKRHWGDKTPPYRRHLRHIFRLVPEAYFIHVIRDGRDVAISYRGLWFGPGDNIEEQARFWVAEITGAKDQARDVPQYLEVRYEELVAEPEKTLRTVCKNLQLTYAPVMLDYYRSADARMAEYVAPFGPVESRPKTAEPYRLIHARTVLPPDPSRIGRWRAELPEADQTRYDAIAGPLLKELGYETRCC